MNTITLIHMLSLQKDKHDYLQTLEIELDFVIDQMRRLGYNMDRNNGLIGKQVLNDRHSLSLYQYFRDVHFMYWGLQGQWPTVDQSDSQYFRGLRGFAENQFNFLK